MFLLQPRLAALSLAPVPFVVLIANRYGRRSRPAIQEAQQRIAELTAEAEENVSGVRVVKAFAQEERQLERFRGLGAARVRPADAGHPDPGLLRPDDQLPAEPRAGGDPPGRRPRGDRRNAQPSAQFTAFYAYLLMLISPMRTLGYMLGAAQRATASGARIFQILDREPQIGRARRRPGAARWPRPGHARGRRASPSTGSPRPALTTSTSRSPAGQTVALVGAMGSGKTALVSLLPRLYDVSAGSVLIDGADVRSVDLHSLRHEIGDRQRRPVPVLRHACTRTSPTVAPRRRARRSSAPRPPPRPMASSASCRRATTRWSASAGSPSRAASASGSRSPARSSPSRGS